MTFYNVKGVTYSEEPTENYHPTLRISSALLSLLASFSSLFWFCDCNVTVLIQYCSIVFSNSSQLFSVKKKKLYKPTARFCPAANIRQTWLVTRW